MAGCRSHWAENVLGIDSNLRQYVDAISSNSIPPYIYMPRRQLYRLIFLPVHII
jgi:hypothetical protein